jgi:hypothetical protein
MVSTVNRFSLQTVWKILNWVVVDGESPKAAAQIAHDFDSNA